MKIVRCRILVLAVMLLAVCGEAWADVQLNKTNFPDSAFYNYLWNSFRSWTINPSDVTTIDVRNKGIKSLKGIEYFTDLEYLYCSANQLVDLDLSKNVKLLHLDCSNNSLISLNISKNTLLRDLYAGSNHLTTLDLSNNTYLLNLNVSSNQLTTLNLSKNPGLETLECQSNQLTTLDLSNNTGLQTLKCYSNGFKTLNLSNHKQLSKLECDFTIDSDSTTTNYYLTTHYYSFNLSDFMTAYGITFDVVNYATAYAHYSSHSTSSEHFTKSAYSGEYVVSFSKHYYYDDALQYISFSLKANGHTADTSVYVYPYSPSSSSPSTPLPTTTDTAPTITTTELDLATVGEEYSFQLISSAVANWTIKGKLPAGLSINSTGLISGTPIKQGSSKITFIAENTLGEDKKTLTLTVYELPAITTEALKPATVGKKYKETIKGTGSKPLTWEFDADLPDGLTLDTNKHKISGKPTSNTYGTVKVTLSNPAGSVTKTFWLGADAILPEIKTKKLKDGTWNKPYKAVIKTKGTEPIELEWKILEGINEWPEGLTFNESTGELSGTPTETCYDLPLRIYAENMGGYTYKDYTLTIKAVPPKFTTTKLPDALKGEEYSAKIEVTGTPEITLAASGLPAGLSMNTSGEISGTPTTSGNFKVSATATNVEKTAKKGLTLNVLSAPEFREGSSSLKSGIVGKSYKYTFSADGTKSTRSARTAQRKSPSA